MNIVEELKAAGPAEALKLWPEMAADCAKTQQRVLREIIDQAKDTAIGRRLHFAEIKSVEDFQRLVPVTEYAYYEEYIAKMAAGEQDVLFAGPTRQFITTSGTTGKAKLIPESETSAAAKSNVVSMRIAILLTLLAKAPGLQRWLADKGLVFESQKMLEYLRRCGVYIIASATESDKTEGGIKIAFASNSTVEGSGIPQLMSYPLELIRLKDRQAISYLTMLFSIKKRDVIAAFGNNASNFKSRLDFIRENAQTLVDDIRHGTITHSISLTPEERSFAESTLTPDPARADELQAILDLGEEHFVPKNYWPYFSMCGFWLSSTVGINVAALQPYFADNIILLDAGYGASEGKINIPYRPGSSSGALATYAAFFEFKDLETGKIYTAEQLEAGKDYDLLLPTFGGLYRYDMHDIVRVVGFQGNTPDIEFITKAGEVLNIAQEKVPAAQVIAYLKDILQSQGAALQQAQIYPDLVGKKYEIYFECSEPVALDKEAIITQLEERLQAGYEVYKISRIIKDLERLEIFPMQEGWQEGLLQERMAAGAPASQIKLKALVDSRPSTAWRQ